MNSLTPCLWFDDQAQEAMSLYCSLLPNSRLGEVTRYVRDAPGGKKAGEVMTVNAILMGVPVIALNGGPMFRFTEAVSFQVPCDTQEEIDRYWNGLLAGGGVPGPCGWLKDRFGLSWQVTPAILPELLAQSDRAAAQRVTDAFMKMGKFDLAAIKAAARG